VAAALLLLILTGAGGEQPENTRPLIAASTTLIRAALVDIYGDAVVIHDIVPPGGCPGHYDLKPDDLAALARADLIVLHEFQKAMKNKLLQAGLTTRPVLMVPEKGSHVTPPGYKLVLGYLAENIPPLVPGLEEASREGLTRAMAAADKADKQARELEAGRLSGKPVVAAQFQAEFCEYWGMNVVAKIKPGDMSARELGTILNAATKNRAVAVVGNRQSGQKSFEALADRLSLPLVMLSNFPESDDLSYQELLLSNLRALIHGVCND
jgi:zinc transport system substrate-binding protein